MLPNAEYLHYGILVYRDVFKKEWNIQQRLEDALGSSDSKYKWNVSQTGYANSDMLYRDSFDFKIKNLGNGNLSLGNSIFPTESKGDSEKELEKIYDQCFQAQISPVEDYRQMFGIAPLKYWEAFNFVKYNANQHFQVHSDHGYSYICTLSSVGYLNDDYEGGELFFDKFNLKIKPKAGDLYLFPSSFIYSHAAMPIQSGTKYSIVTMLDYLEAPHTPEYREIEKKYTEGYA